MNDDYHFVHDDDPDDAAVTRVGMGVHNYNIEQAGNLDYRRLCIFLQGPDGEIAGGVIGATFWDWFYLDLLWIQDDLRRKGFGRRLVQLAEEEARKRGARFAYLDTFSFQAPGFYDKLGYQVFGELPEFPAGERRYFYTKAL